MTYQTLLKCALRWIIAVSLGATTAVSGATEQDQDLPGSQAGKPGAARPTIIYKPPILDTPRTRAGTSARGEAGEASIVQVLAPDHVGLTTQAQPVLYWYARTPVAVRFELLSIDDAGGDSLLKVEAGSGKVAGIRQLDLGDHNISLQPGVTYQWSVAPLLDEDGHAAGATASAVIERLKPGEGLTSRLENNHGTDLVDVLASEGIWYDALETISSMIDQSPGDRGLVAIRTSLLDQIGMHAENRGQTPVSANIRKNWDLTPNIGTGCAVVPKAYIRGPGLTIQL